MERCPARRFSGIGNGADVLASEVVRVEVALPLVRVLLFGLWLELAALIAVVIHRGTSIGLRMQSALRQQDACRRIDKARTTLQTRRAGERLSARLAAHRGILRCDDLCRAEM